MEPKVIVGVLIQASTILLMFAVGLRGRWADLGYALARPRLLLNGFIAVYVAVPLAAFMAALVLPLEPAVKIGIVAMALSPLAPLAPGKMLKAGAGPSFVVGAYVGLLALAVVAVPATLALVTSITGGTARIGIGTVTWLVVSSVLVPVTFGILVGNRVPRLADRLSAMVSLAANLALAIVIVLILIVAGGEIFGLIGNGTLAAIVVAALAGLAAGHVLGGPAPNERMALAQAAAARHPGIAALMVQQNFEDQRPMLAAVLLYLLVGALVSALYSRWARKRLSLPADASAAPTAA